MEIERSPAGPGSELCAGGSGFIVKAPKIGWGYLDTLIEMAKTRAGTSASVKINNLTRGGFPYAAAEGLAAFLTRNGCEADMLPKFDLLKTMIVYLDLFLAEGGFRKVFGHVASCNSRIEIIMCSLSVISSSDLF